ncbi:hypothetical protein TELCIR_12128 [Teladorsagia circumcincta]|uniref:C-type lectin domain-containing protein n=1 Tax=Teladorsagia circumcincta TaxID=45464 RepID=A0A2G9U7J9_TELCI|nr:hypothetical protein TELCIR_12128 [Teladorsagia circumcincta]
MSVSPLLLHIYCLLLVLPGTASAAVKSDEKSEKNDLAKKANLTTPTVWLGRLVRLARTGAYEWHDGAIGRQADGFRGEPPSGTELCLTMWLDFDRPEGSWNEWDCGYASGYSALCKKSLKKPAFPISSKFADGAPDAGTALGWLVTLAIVRIMFIIGV